MKPSTSITMRKSPLGFALILGLIVSSLGLIVCGFQGCDGGSSSSPTPASSPPTTAIGASPAALSFTATQGGANPATQSVTISNTGGTLSWTASENAAWLTLSPASGSGTDTLAASVNTAGLATGTYNGTITVAASGAASQSVSVTLTVVAAPGTLPAFPLVASGNQRYLQDQNGVPLPILGRTAWFITSLSETDYKAFIDDTVAKGYNAIEFHVVNHDPDGNKPPFGGNGTLLPFSQRLDESTWTGSLSYGNLFTDAPDFSKPNEPYWQFVDALLAYAEAKGVLCFMFPAYVGFGGGTDGWMAEMTANGGSKMTAYGAFIANRYKTRGNIVWMLGGDHGTGANSFTAPQLVVEQAMLAGLQSIAGQQSVHFSAEWNNPSIYTDQADPTLRAAGTLQGTYSWVDPTSTTRNGYNYTPAMPTFLLEEPYDEEGQDGTNVDPYATQPVRRFQWWGWLSGIGGYISGNGYIWRFNSGWQAHLNTQGTQDMARLNAFVQSIAWYNLVPSGLGGMKTLVTGGNASPSSSNYVAAAASPDGTVLVAYVPPDHSGSITIDMTAMSGPARARWFNPASAAYTVIGTIANIGTSSFTPPGNNGTGFTDWVLLLETQ